MTEKVVEVLARILDGLNKNITLEELNQTLSTNNEFDKQTVSTAYSLVYDKLLSGKIKENKKRGVNRKHRMLTDEEKEILGNENSSYLLHLHNVGLLDTIDLEMVLEQVMMFPDETINRNDINWLVYISLVEFNSEILPGSRILLNSNDTIN